MATIRMVRLGIVEDGYSEGWDGKCGDVVRGVGEDRDGEGRDGDGKDGECKDGVGEGGVGKS